MSPVADLPAMFPDFGIPAIVGGVALTALFDDEYAAALDAVAGSTPVLMVQTASVPAVALGAAVVADSTNYTVVGIQPDGTGITRLILQEA